jgi:hypothetical protein
MHHARTDPKDLSLAVILLVHAIGDFRVVGFFRRICDTRFARLDTTVYSPLCLIVVIGTAIVGFARSG